MDMDATLAATTIRKWLASEKLETREVQDNQNFLHLHVRYPPTKAAHLFNIVIPKNRNLVLIYSITRVDEGQQLEMKEHYSSDSLEWETWLHETRILLTQANLDWVLHIGKKEQKETGPLQAFNLSRPIWFDGLTQNEFMHTMRKVWLTKLSLIHKIKFGYGPGTGKPGPVDDWPKKSKKNPREKKSKHEKMDINFDETGGFGRSFDRDEWA